MTKSKIDQADKNSKPELIDIHKIYRTRGGEYILSCIARIVTISTAAKESAEDIEFVGGEYLDVSRGWIPCKWDSRGRSEAGISALDLVEVKENRSVEICWERKAYELYLLLDNIDTASDLPSTKDNDSFYKHLVLLEHTSRFAVLSKSEIESLHNKFIKLPSIVPACFNVFE